MFGRFVGSGTTQQVETPRGFDSFDMRLGDIMRGERATLGKSLLDVQRELRIKASYIAAIENADPSAFESPGFIAGYVRSYARYLGMDADQAFETFCRESGFSGVNSFARSGPKPEAPRGQPAQGGKGDPLFAGGSVFDANACYDSIFDRIEPGALGSFAVLGALILGLGYGGLTLLQEFQRVQVAPVEEAPGVFAELDPLEGVSFGAQDEVPDGAASAGLAPRVTTAALDRLYRPSALDAPILTARDAPISTIAPGALGALADASKSDLAQAAVTEEVAPEVPRVLEEAAKDVTLVAARPAWVRVSGADGSVLFEKILDAGETYTLPQTEAPPTLHAGNAGSVYFQIGEQTYGPAGAGASVVRNVVLGAEPVQQAYAQVDPEADQDLVVVMQALATQAAQPE